MEEGRGQTNSNVHGSHLIFLHGGDVAEEAEQSLQNFPVLISHEHDGSLHCLQPLLLGDIWGEQVMVRGSIVGSDKEPEG